MINNDLELKIAHDALADLHRAVAALNRELGPRAFEVAAEGPLHEIERLQSEIARYSGVDLVGLEAPTVWLRLVGPRAQWHNIPASVLTAFLDALRKGIQAVTAFNRTGQRGGRPPVPVQDACDFRVLQFAPGSFTVALKLPDAAQGKLFPSEDREAAHIAFGEYLETAGWAASRQPPSEVERLFPDPQKRRVLLRAVKSLVPRPLGGVDYVELTSPSSSPAPTVLSPDAAGHILEALEFAISPEEERYIGEIREIDLDKNHFRLRHVDDGHGEIPCRFPDDLAQTARALLGTRVRVIGSRRIVLGEHGRWLEVIDVEKVDEGGTPKTDSAWR